MPLQVQGSDKTKLEVHGSVIARFKITNSYKIRQKVHSSATAGVYRCLHYSAVTKQVTNNQK